MKKIGEHTIRGTADNLETIRITLFDGDFGTGFKITKFVVSPNLGSAGNDVYGKIMTEDLGTSPRVWDWQDQREIAWAASPSITTGVKEQTFSLVDRENLVIEDIYFVAEDNDDDRINYYIEMDKYEFTEWNGALQIVRNSSQG